MNILQSRKRDRFPLEGGEQSQHTSLLGRNDLISRKDVCTMYNWSQGELEWRMKYAGLPHRHGKLFSRVALQTWAMTSDAYEDNDYADTQHYRLMRRRAS